jgi:hypothetical protein
MGPAIVSGVCAVAVALITGAFNWINRSPTETPSAPVLTIGPDSRGDRSADATSDGRPAPERPSPARPEPIYSLNFAAYQSQVRDTGTSDEVRRRIIDRVVGNAVLWQGYVARVVENDPREQGWIATVVLVEDPSLVTQTLLPCAAYCRFREDPEGRLARLKPGMQVTISGDCTGHTIVSTEIENCRMSTAARARTAARTEGPTAGETR